MPLRSAFISIVVSLGSSIVSSVHAFDVDPNNPYQYIIITKPVWVDEWQPLA